MNPCNSLFSDWRRKDQVFWLCLLIWFGTFILFLPVLSFDFIVLDDHGYVTKNSHVASGLSFENLLWAFTTLTGDMSYWHPVTWISHQLDCQLFGLRPSAHHLTSVLFHCSAGVLLFLFLDRATGRLGCSAMVGALFCVHPMHVESVAWIAERKDVLTSVFWFATLLAYVNYARQRSFVRYLLVMLFFALDLMSKPSAVTLPFVLLLLDYWPLRRVAGASFEVSGSGLSPSVEIPRKSGVTTLVVEKLPFFVLTAVASWAAFAAQRDLGAMAPLDGLNRSSRLDNVIVAYGAYVLKMLWPSNLAVIYTRTGPWPFQLVVSAGTFLSAVSLVVVRIRRANPYLFVGWFWFIGVLVPMIGLVQVGAQWMADRYTYISATGLFIIVVWGGAAASQRLMIPSALIKGAIAVLILVQVPITFLQLQHWKNSETLFAHAVAVTPRNWLAHHDLALALANEGKNEEADRHLEEAIAIVPRSPTVNKTRGNVKLNMGDSKAAAALYREVLAVTPNDLEANRRLAWIYATSEDTDLRSGFLALEHAKVVYKQSKVADASQFDVLAAAHAENGEFDEAGSTAKRAITLAEVAGQDPAEIRKRLELYQAGKPYRSKFEPIKRNAQKEKVMRNHDEPVL